MKFILAAMLFMSSAVSAELPKQLFDRNSFVLLSGKDAFGSAVVIATKDDRAYLLTAKHVLTAKELKIRGFPIRIEKVSKKYDLALISVKNQGFKVVPLSQTSPEKGSVVYTAGHPTYLRALIPTKGHFSNLSTYGRVITAPSAGGTSGGAVLVCDKQCSLIGIVWGTSLERNSRVNFLTLIVSIEQIREFLEIDKKTN